MKPDPSHATSEAQDERGISDVGDVIVSISTIMRRVGRRYKATGIG